MARYRSKPGLYVEPDVINTRMKDSGFKRNIIPKKKRNNNKKPIKRIEKENELDIDEQNVDKGGSIAHTAINKVKKEIKKNKGVISHTIDDIKGLTHTELKHITGNLNSHEFNLIRGLASKVLNVPHPLDNHIKGGSLQVPDNIHRGAFEDILNAKSPSHLSEMLHREHLASETEDVGGGLGDAVKHTISTGIDIGKTVSSGAVGVTNSINSLVQKGLMLSKLFENTVKVTDPTTYAKYLPLFKAIEAAASITSKTHQGASLLNSLLHSSAIENFQKALFT